MLRSARSSSQNRPAPSVGALVVLDAALRRVEHDRGRIETHVDSTGAVATLSHSAAALRSRAILCAVDRRRGSDEAIVAARARTSQNTRSEPRRAMISISRRPTRTLRATTSKPRRVQVRARHVLGAATQAGSHAPSASALLVRRLGTQPGADAQSRLRRAGLHAVAAANAGAALLEHVHAAVAGRDTRTRRSPSPSRRNGTCSTRDRRRPSRSAHLTIAIGRSSRPSDRTLRLSARARCTCRADRRARWNTRQTRVSHCTELDSTYDSLSAKPVSGTCSGKHGAPTFGDRAADKQQRHQAHRFRRATQTWHR